MTIRSQPTEFADAGALRAHACSAEAVAQAQETDLERGLTDAEAAERLQRFGPNQLREEPPAPAWRRFFAQFRQLVIWILIVAAVIAGAVGELVDAAAILAIVLLNGVIGYLQESRAEQAIAALKRLAQPVAKVIRGGKLKPVPAVELVKGDVVELEAGDFVPADVRLSAAYDLQVQEASLTGESTPVEKDAAAVLAEEAALGDRVNMCYLGTTVTAGKASAIVVAAGMQTELGKIAGLITQQDRVATPLERRLAELGRLLVVVCLVLVAVVFGLELARGGKLLEVLLVSISLAVAAVPEGLPAVVTLALAIGLQRMAKRNALVRKLPSVETLGSVTVICSDKTGTLTRNEMTVRAIVVGDEQLEVTGSGYNPEGQFLNHGQPIDATGRAALGLLMTIGARCNHAAVVPSKNDDGQWQALGDPTEAALVVAAQKAGIEQKPADVRQVFEIPFDSQRRLMSVVVQEADGRRVLYVKGAPEAVLARSAQEFSGEQPRPLDDARRREILEHNGVLAKRALRVLGLAYKPVGGESEHTEENLIFVGLAGMIDPPRDEARLAIAACGTAGIKPVMITGDHPATAEAVARELGLLGEGGKVLTGQQLEPLSDDALAEQVTAVNVYARVSAEHKLRIVNAWQRREQVVAMTGDGVNDAPAVKAADIGIAMGITGTDVTKEASDMVLTDDNFRSIVSAVEEGRNIFDNIQSVVHYLLACNAGEVLFMFAAAVVGWPIPLAAVQILWINLITDGLPALALAMEPPDRDVMRRPPRPPREPVLTGRRGGLIVVHGMLIAATTAAGYWYVLSGGEGAVEKARTTAFCVLAFSQLFLSLACRNQRRTLPELGLLSNPYLLAAIVGSGVLQLLVVSVPFLQPIFQVKAGLAQEWPIVAGLSLVPVTVLEVTKLVLAAYRRRARRTTPC